jgi:hypothetical protein
MSAAALFYRISKLVLRRQTRQSLKKFRGGNLIARLRLGLKRPAQVLAGPFSGLLYPTYGIGSEYFPKLLGTYELELHEAIRALSGQAFDRIVVIGAGEGYYVGGLAQLFPDSRITCFEADPDGQAAVADMAAENGFTVRLENRGFCAPEDLRASLDSLDRTLVVMDVEGGERQLLDPEAIPALARATIVVEVHDCFEPGLDGLLKERFKASHHCLDILSRPRTREDADLVPVGPRLRSKLLPLMDEGRPSRMRWFVLTPQSPP